MGMTLCPKRANGRERPDHQRSESFATPRKEVVLISLLQALGEGFVPIGEPPGEEGSSPPCSTWMQGLSFFQSSLQALARKKNFAILEP